MKPRLIIISDLWGFGSAPWLSVYLRSLNPHFEIQLYDAKKLASIPNSVQEKESIHHAFTHGGIEKAEVNLSALEQGPVHVLAFSIGGVIAWKAALNSLRLKSLFTFSATRLRKESQVPKGTISLWFGEKDSFKPGADWLKEKSIDIHIIPDAEHSCYREEEWAKLLCQNILSTGR